MAVATNVAVPVVAAVEDITTLGLANDSAKTSVKNLVTQSP
jgi:hypothetical protein